MVRSIEPHYWATSTVDQTLDHTSDQLKFNKVSISAYITSALMCLALTF